MINALIGIVVGWFLSMFSDPVKERLWGPRLSIQFDPKSPVDSHMTPIFQPNGESFPSFWTRVRVLNSGRSVARDVEVIARRLARLGSLGQYEVVPHFAPLNLKWSYVGEPVMERIPRQVERLCDVFHIPWRHADDDIRDDDAPMPKPLAHLALVAHSVAQPGVLPPGTYRLELVATAANSSQTVKALVFNVPEKWNEKREALAEAVGANLHASFAR